MASLISCVSLTNDIKEVCHLLRLDILPRCRKRLLVQSRVVSLNGPATGVSDQNHDVSQDSSCPLLNEGRRSWFPLDLSLGQMRILTEWQKQLNRGQQIIQSRLMARLRTLFQVEVPLRRLFKTPTIAELALAIEQIQSEKIEQAESAELAQVFSDLGELSEDEIQALFAD